MPLNRSTNSSKNLDPGATPEDPDQTRDYPGGASDPGYNLAFRVWIGLFLLLIAIGLLNYLGLFLHRA